MEKPIFDVSSLRNPRSMPQGIPDINAGRYQPEGAFEPIGQVNSNGRGQSVIGQEYMPSDREKALGIDKMMGMPEVGKGLYSNNYYNRGSAWEDPRTNPVGFFQPGYGEPGQAAREMWGLDPSGLSAQASRQAAADQQLAAAQAMQSPQVQAAIQGAALGQGPSAAEGMLNNSMGQAMRNQMIMAANTKGGPLAQYGAQQAAMQNVGQMQSALSSQLAALRANEMANARGQYLQQAGLGLDRERFYGGQGMDLYKDELARKMDLGKSTADLTMQIMGHRAAEDAEKFNRVARAVGTGVQVGSSLGAAYAGKK